MNGKAPEKNTWKELQEQLEMSLHNAKMQIALFEHQLEFVKTQKD